MRIRIVFRYVGIVLLLNSVFMLVSAGISYFNSDSAFFPLIFSSVIAFLFGIFPIVFVPASDEISNSEGLVIVVSAWLLSCIAGMIPYVMWGGEFTVTNSWFESVSGFTTTGASILTEIQSLPKGLLFWRAATHWIGGVGIIIFVLSVLPSMGIATMVLYRSEMSPAAIRQFKMRAKEAVRILLYIYLGLTVLETVSLSFAGMSVYDAVTHSFATIATGGFSTKNSSIAYFDNIAIEIIIMIFMILSGMNFALLFSAVIGKFSDLRKSTVVKYYLGINFIGIILVSLSIYGSNYGSYWQSLRYAAFQILSVGTSTGFANADSSVWPGFAQLIIIFFTLQCASAGSTSGGIKIDRIVILFKSIVRRIRQLLYPKAVLPVYLDDRRIEDSSVEATAIYILLYIMIVFIAAISLTALGLDPLSAFSGSAACMGNVGPGLSILGSLENYSAVPNLGKWIFTLTMLLGRLEIYGLILFFFKKTWE